MAQGSLEDGVEPTVEVPGLLLELPANGEVVRRAGGRHDGFRNGLQRHEHWRARGRCNFTAGVRRSRGLAWPFGPLCWRWGLWWTDEGGALSLARFTKSASLALFSGIAAPP